MRMAEFSVPYDHLGAQQLRPKIHVANYNELRRGGTAKVWIDAYPLPEIDYHARRFLPPGRIRPKKPIYACWRTASGQRTRSLDHRQDNLYTMDIPEDAVDGLLFLLVPASSGSGWKRWHLAQGKDLVQQAGRLDR